MNKKIITLMLFIFVTAPAYAEVNDNDGVRSLLGECRGQRYPEVYAHACALKNRGTLQGVYGYKAKLKEGLTKKALDKCQKAWYNAKTGEDVVHGRTEWRSDYDILQLKKSLSKAEYEKHFSDLLKPLKIGETTFYYSKARLERERIEREKKAKKVLTIS